MTTISCLKCWPYRLIKSNSAISEERWIPRIRKRIVKLLNIIGFAYYDLLKIV